MPELSVCLPCYNEAKGVREILERFAAAGANHDFELLLVNNGSTDETQSVLDELVPQYDFARTVIVEQNVGYGHGIFTGLEAAEGTFLAWSHADLQTDPADVFRAFDVVTAAENPKRTLVKGMRLGRLWAERLISRGMEIVALMILWRWIREINAQPKVFHRELMPLLTTPPLDFNLDTYVICQALEHGWQIETIEVLFPPRPYGVSKWAANWRSKLRHIWSSVRFMASYRTNRWEDS